MERATSPNHRSVEAKLTVYEEDELLPVSALQHLLFCERRASLVYIERLWEENVFTTEGTILHERAHEAETEVRGDLRIARGLSLRSISFGLVGKADVVEFNRMPEGETGVPLEDVAGLWQPMPVEYKRGTLRKEEGYEIQLCAQAFCLEEMLNTHISSGAIYYGKTRRRLEIPFDTRLRKETEMAILRLRELIDSGRTPQAVYSKKCESCSLIELCLPKTTGKKASVEKYLQKMVANPP
ncbi:MAG: CRISPR-associated protein Cas4 [Dehalococcoidia bacterium]